MIGQKKNKKKNHLGVADFIAVTMQLAVYYYYS